MKRLIVWIKWSYKGHYVGIIFDEMLIKVNKVAKNIEHHEQKRGIQIHDGLNSWSIQMPLDETIYLRKFNSIEWNSFFSPNLL